MGAAALPLAVGTQAAGGLYSSYMAGEAGKTQRGYYNYLADTARTNAGLAKASATANLNALGYQESQEQRALTNKLRTVEGAQVAAEAAGGAGASSKTAEQIASDTANKGSLDEQALRYNAALKAKAISTGADSAAFNYESQARGYNLAGSNAMTSARNSQFASILSSGAGIASSFQKFPAWP